MKNVICPSAFDKAPLLGFVTPINFCYGFL